MNRRNLVPVLALVASLVLPAVAQETPRGIFVPYPYTPRVPQVDDYFGTKVADPYRWLEDDNSPQTIAWVQAENNLTFAYLAGIPEREGIRQRITKLWNYEKFGAPGKEGGKYFYSYNSGLQPQAALFVADKLDAQGRILLDPNTLRADGTAALSGTAVSDDGKLIAYGVADAGSDWNTWKVRDITTGNDLPDEVKWVKFSNGSWTKDGKGFFYSRFDAPEEGKALTGSNKFQKLYFHALGSGQDKDVLIYERKDQPDWGFGGSVTDDGGYLAINVSEGTDKRNRFYYKNLKSGGDVVKLFDALEASYDFIDNAGPVFYFLNDLKAPRNQVIAVDTSKPAGQNTTVVIPESEGTLVSATLIGGHFICNYLKDARSEVKVFSRDGKFVRSVDLPGIGTASGFGGKANDPETFYTFTSYTMPPTVFRYDVATGQSTVYKSAKVDFNPADYETKQVFYTSKDGTKVPMFITSRRGIKLDGNNPTLLYGYGGFNIPMTPGFSVGNLVWMEMGGVYVVANLRGGGEYGEDWHQAGMKLKKQNVFDDFIGAGEWLVKNNYTSNKKLAIFGGSNGGLLVGACSTQRPDLFAAAIPAVGVMDMLRFHKFTIGHAWRSDYGSSENEPEFKVLNGYSPYHALLRAKPGTRFPATMVTTADHDDRVVPGHSFKYAAALQAVQGGEAPALIRIETRAGHGAGKPTAKRIEEAADMWGFLFKNLNMDPALAPKAAEAAAAAK
ncbi:MAG: prolyl oligopeptidase family serine peptidase [Phycisphaerales bacterium]